MAAAGGSETGVSDETRRAERDHFESVIRAFLYYREHGLQIIKKAEVNFLLAVCICISVFMSVDLYIYVYMYSYLYPHTHRYMFARLYMHMYVYP